MQSAEGNPTQAQQNEMAAKSPAKTPAAGSAMPDENSQAREFGSKKGAMSAESVAAKNPAPLPPIEIEREVPAQQIGDPVSRANSRIVSVDNAGMSLTDDTVDTDGKGLEAMRDASQWQDNIVYSNATLENNVPVPAEGLVDLDTRAGGSMPVIATREGWRVRTVGMVDIARGSNGVRGEQIFTLDRIEDGESGESSGEQS
jgi:hypothetical protein